MNIWILKKTGKIASVRRHNNIASSLLRDKNISAWKLKEKYSGLMENWKYTDINRNSRKDNSSIWEISHIILWSQKLFRRVGNLIKSYKMAKNIIMYQMSTRLLFDFDLAKMKGIWFKIFPVFPKSLEVWKIAHLKF